MTRPNYDESTMGDLNAYDAVAQPLATDPLIAAIDRLTVQVERIADQGAEADIHVTETEVHEAWESTGQRAQHHLAVALVEKLGIVVDA